MHYIITLYLYNIPHYIYIIYYSSVQNRSDNKSVPVELNFEIFMDGPDSVALKLCEYTTLRCKGMQEFKHTFLRCLCPPSIFGCLSKLFIVPDNRMTTYCEHCTVLPDFVHSEVVENSADQFRLVLIVYVRP